METNEIKKQIETTIKQILDAEYIVEEEKEISYLIHMVQLYCRKGGNEDLW